ncbi:DUF1273 domain-containing protein [Cohnella thailandensis]|uniref:DUF1273 domain-containing protein n=1 Tax=Cohnella thailandensis TaxID=557557 RepID=A0A841SS72_9BACL|nr:DUF1273 domain-containing protein [Cohnella thailandensis]MBB6635213.1 DUF1273 domain-containing protein [Cohnella thailandensis]MBP1974320.1 putative phage-like protein YoqJ [Cohnella thailandensis]
MKNLLVTGYRAHELGIFGQKHKGIAYIKKAIEAKLVPLADEGLEWVLTPGQYGVDLWACEVVIELRKRFPELKLSILTAYANPEEKWKDDRKDYYQGIIGQVDYYGAVSKQPYSGVWQFKARDELLLRKSDGILLVYDEDSGEASPRFFKEAALRRNAKDGYRYLSIGAEDIQSIAEESESRYYE